VAISFNGGKDCGSSLSEIPRLYLSLTRLWLIGTVLLHLLAVALWHRRKLSTAVSSIADADSASHSGSLAPSQAVVPPSQFTALAVDAPSSSSMSIPSLIPKPFKALYVTCSSPFSQVDAFVLQCAQSYHLDLFETHPEGLPMKEALRQYQEREPAVKSILVGTRRADPHGGELSSSILSSQTSGLLPFSAIYTQTNGMGTEIVYREFGFKDTNRRRLAKIPESASNLELDLWRNMGVFEEI
jgi:hypothetical protein